LARKGIVPPAKAFEVISVEAMRLKRLADDILDVSRIEGKRLALKKEYFSVNAMLAGVVESARTTIKVDAVTLKFTPSTDVVLKHEEKPGLTQSEYASDFIFADKYRIVQVITNILNNAVKFTKQGSIEVSTKLLDGGNAIEISVSDTGGGIPDEIFPKLFDKFATKGVAEGTQNGTGLGLFISQSIIKEHDGSIAGLNNSNGGATFRVVLPTTRAMHKTQIPRSTKPEVSELESVRTRQPPGDQILEKVVPSLDSRTVNSTITANSGQAHALNS